MITKVDYDNNNLNFFGGFEGFMRLSIFPMTFNSINPVDSFNMFLLKLNAHLVHLYIILVETVLSNGLKGVIINFFLNLVLLHWLIRLV